MAPQTPTSSQESLQQANEDQAERSTHGGLGQAGFVSEQDRHQASAFLSSPGEVAVVDVPVGKPLPNFNIGVAWDNIVVEQETNFFKKLIKKEVLHAGVDLDLGCLYKLKNGRRGGMQAFGDLHGAISEEPYIMLSGDERTGDRKGPDEIIMVNGAHWADIEQILIYVYIYEGARDWGSVRPQVQVRVPGEQPMIVTLNARRSSMSVCAVAGLENVRGGIKMTSYLEYFPGHAEMDRAFGFGLEWESGGKKS